MDPITATTTMITLAAFIKDLIDVGQSIKSSIDKVSENRRQIRDLTDDILHVLSEMDKLSRQQAGQSQVPALLTCRKISPAQPSPGFRGFRSQIKVWMKRDDIEAKIRCLKEHVNKCYLKFTAFSAARIEQTTTRIKETTHRTDNTTLRVEQSLIVNHVENQVKLRQLEGLMARVLLETQFGQDVMSRTIEIMASARLKDVSHQTLEFKYLSAQTLRLVDLLQHSVVRRPLVLDRPLWDGTSLVFTKPASVDHILSQILGVIVAIKESRGDIPFSSIQGILHLSSQLDILQMNSEATACALMTINIFRRLSTGGFRSAPELLPNLANSSNQLRWDLATKASQRAMDCCRSWQEISPDVEHRLLLGGILITHSDNLRMNGLLEVAISIAEEAVAVFRGMAAQLIEAAAEISCWGEEEEYKAVTFSEAFLAHPVALSSAGQHFGAYEAAKEGLQTVLRFPRTSYSPPAKVIDTFIDQLCHVAEEGSLSLSMLADDMILFRDLARGYSEFSIPFLRSLHAYVYMSQQQCPDFHNLRIFLEPNSRLPIPVLDPFRELNIQDCIDVIKDAMRAYCRLWPTIRDVLLLIENIFIAHFDQAVAVLREIASKFMTIPNSDPTSIFFASGLSDILPLVTCAQKLVLVEIMTKIVGHLRTNTAVFRQSMLWTVSWALWNAGLLNDAIALCDEAVEYLRCSPKDKFEDYDIGLDSWLMRRTFILWDMGKIPQAIEEARLVVVEKTTDSLNLNILDYLIMRKQILQRTGRNWEAVKLLRGACGEVEQLRVEDPYVYEYAHILPADLAAAWRLAGQLRKAVEDAERAVAACREDAEDTETQKHVLVHSLTALSHCLAGVGRNDEALEAAEEAASIYSLHPLRMWTVSLYTFRREESGANVFHALSLRLVASGQLEAALLNAEKATELYRKLVSLAPRHLPTLASSLQNLASILWNVGRRDQSISASHEAISIMRKVADSETYFLGVLGEALDQLAGYLAEKGDSEGASDAMDESAEVRRRIELLPPEPEFLFLYFETESDDQEWETATESEEEYHDAAVDVEAVGVDPARTITSQNLALTPPKPSSTETQSEQNGIPWRAVSQAPVMASMAQATMSPVASQYEDNVSEDIAKPEMPPPRAAAILNTPLEVKLHLRSTPMDIIWWILLGVLSVALAAVWHRE
ncbi:hypothetical protein DFH09DRAFT_1290728 [Mycena vulgaris]|nr:hypothetical protein DFH09DRAFT_1290728 [Mycena vulgaris]